MVATPQGTIERRPLNAAVKPCGLHLLLLLLEFHFALAILRYGAWAYIRAEHSTAFTTGSAAEGSSQRRYLQQVLPDHQGGGGGHCLVRGPNRHLR